MFFHVRLVDLTVYIYYRPLVSATLLGVSRRGGSSSRRFPAKTGTVGFPTIIIYFYKVYLNTLDICFRWILGHVQYGQSLEGSAPILRFLFSLDISDVFGGDSEVVGEFSPSLPRELASLFCLKYLGFSALVSGSDLYPLIGRRSLRAMGCLKVLPDSWGFWNFLYEILRNCEATSQEV